MNKHRKPSAIIFDFDDTLVNARPIINKALTATFNHFGLSEEIIKLKNIDINLSLRDYFYSIFADNVKEARDVYYSNYIEYAKDLETLEHSEDVLKILRKNNVYTAIVSNKNAPRLRYEVTEKFLWKDYFNQIIGSGDSEKDKPSPLPAKISLQNANITDYSNVWLIGDSLVDLKTAENLGCKAVLFGNLNLQDTSKFYFTVRNHAELLRILKDLYV
ncbi:MAG: HAD-IA family hydrolase [Rickettsiales bacterium]|jgi:phosphoglycolate phosphatase|nr:HAD-IA family hydrolase [Rickettsiales bacterium]